MNRESGRANILLFLTAAIWGLAFVGQRASIEHIGPFFFNAVRFALGATSLLPIYFIQKRRGSRSVSAERCGSANMRSLIVWSVLAGVLMFLGSSFQQVGVKYTTAGNAGFITGLYVIIVPIIGIFMGRKTRKQTWVGAAFALTGMYFLSVKSGFDMGNGDLLVLVSALFWACHVQLLGKISQQFDAIAISIIQFYICALLSLIVAFFVEIVAVASVLDAWMSIVYTGLFSVGVAYTLQVFAQKHAHPSEAAIILSFESVFAVIGGMLVLGEVLSLRGGIGCSLMLIGMIFSQLRYRKR